MAPKYSAPSLEDKPVDLADKFIGYFNEADPTTLPNNALISPSINCFIPDKDKIVPRKGTTLLGVGYTANKNWPIIGHKKRFSNMAGYVLEVRVAQSDDANLRDIIEVLAPVFDSSGNATSVYTWYQITKDVNPLSQAVAKLGMRARWYLDDWFDTNTASSSSLNVPRLVGVNGTTQVINWTGGIAPIVSLVANTSITTTAGVTWASLGFVDPALGGSGNVIINGVSYTITGGWATSTLTLANTTGITVGDVATSEIQADTTTVAFDSIRQNKNYLFYGSWKTRKYFMANNFNRPASQEITNVQAVQNDLVVDQSVPYTGTGSHVYRVTIDSVNPPVNQSSFTGNGTNDGVYITSGYSLTDGITHEYKVSVVADYTLAIPSATTDFTEGHPIRGGTSQAEGIIMFRVAIIAVPGFDYLAVRLTNGKPFQDGETVTDLATSGPATTVVPIVVASNDWIQCTKDGTVFNTTTGAQGSQAISLMGGTTNLSDGLVIKFTNVLVHAIGDTFTLKINVGGADTFHWQKDGGTASAPIAITTANQLIELGLTISFTSKTGHAIGDFWDITVNQSVTKAWVNFYYTLPGRKPGEGYVYNLPSNFWTHDVQEEQMYINGSYGEWGFVTTQLSADLLSETVSYTPLKQVTSAKVIYPYMIGPFENALSFITENKKFEMIQRQELVQLPQIGYLSQPVNFDFEILSFENGSMEYLNKIMYITSPEETGMMVYDNQDGNHYWQPPQVIPECGILSTVGNKLIAHSNLRNQTFTLFEGDDDNGFAYTVKARTAYNSYGDRWQLKSSSYSFIEGRISGAPPLVFSVVLGDGGCQAVLPHDVKPITCVPFDRASLGKGHLGSHPLGSDLYTEGTHFNEIHKDLGVLNYYFAALDVECTTKNHTYSILSMGLNAIESNIGNNALVPEEVISKD